MSNLIEFAKVELDKILDDCDTQEDIELQKIMNDGILKVVEAFDSADHSGFSASYAINVIERLLRFLPLSSLTGEDDEWVELNYGGGLDYQNKRCSSVFKTKDGNAYISDGRIFSDDGGHTWYTSKDSKVDITFPYDVPTQPERVIIDNEFERNAIKGDVISILMHSFGLLDISNITEETKLNDMISDINVKDLEMAIIDKFKLPKLAFKIEPEDKIWQVVKTVMYSKDE